MRLFPKWLAISLVASFIAIAIACTESEATPEADGTDTTASPTAAPDLDATVAANVEATLAAQSTPTPPVAATATPPVRPTATPARPVTTPTATPPPPTPTSTPNVGVPIVNPVPVIPASVASVRVEASSDTLVEDESTQFTAVVTDGPGNELTGRPITWTSSNSDVAQVSSTGTVTGISAGFASITATADGVSGTVNIEVTHGPVASIEIALGDGANLVAALRDAKGNLLSDRTVTWSSDDTSVIQVDANTGAISVIGLGAAVITARSEGVSATATLTVSNEPIATVLVEPEDVSVESGSSVQLTAAPLDSEGGLLSGRVVTWSSSDESVALVSPDGLVTGVSVGEATITASSEGVEGTATVTVTAIPIAQFALTPESLLLAEGESSQLVADTQDADGGSLSDRAISWASSDNSIADVSSSGVVTAISAGTATISATAEGVTATMTLEVTHGPVASIEIGLGANAQLIATLRDAQGHLLEDRSVTWSTSDASVLDVDPQTGQLSIGAPGTATVTATSEAVSASAVITVSQTPVDSVEVTPGDTTIQVGGTVQLTASPKDADGNILTGRDVSWSSSSNSTATVSDSGVVTGLAAGTITISATVDGTTGTTTVRVEPQPILNYELRYSTSSTRSNSRSLSGANLTGNVYIFVTPSENVASVDFYLDDPLRNSSPRRTETNAPFDFAGTQNNGRANPFDTDLLRNGTGAGHSVTAVIRLEDGRVVTVSRSFSLEDLPPPIEPLPPGEYELLWSQSSNRSNPMPLDGATVTGNIYVFTGPDQAVESVSFYINDIDLESPPHRIETRAPFDLQGAGGNGRANAYDTEPLAELRGTLGSILLGGSNAVFTAVFTFTDGTTLQIDANVNVVLPVVEEPLPPDEYQLLWSASSDRSDPVPLAGETTISGDIYVFTSPDQAVESVSFYIEDPGTQNAPYRTETNAPFDLEGTRGNGRANAFDTEPFSDANATFTPQVWFTAVITFTNGDTTQINHRVSVVPPAPPPLKFNTVSAGVLHSCGHTDQRLAYCWGADNNGQLGAGPGGQDSNVPVLVLTDLPFVDVGAGSGHSCGRTAQGQVQCWGRNQAGQLGDGSNNDSETPVLVNTDQLFSSITVGNSHSCGLTFQGDAYCWGLNFLDQLGLGGEIDVSAQSVPALVAGGLKFKSLSAGDSHTCGVTTDGTGYCWGNPNQGRLGNGVDGISVADPTEVAGGHTFTTIQAGGGHTCGITTSGAVYCWGIGNLGQLGIGDVDNSTVALEPVRAAINLKVTSLTLGPAHTCAITTGREVYCWGLNAAGQLGISSVGGSANVPTPVAGGHSFMYIDAGTDHTCGVTTRKEALCWGNGVLGRLGTGNEDRAVVPTLVAPPLDIFPFFTNPVLQ